MIGFSAGNAWGQAKVKAAFNDLLGKITDGMKTAAENSRKTNETKTP